MYKKYYLLVNKIPFVGKNLHTFGEWRELQRREIELECLAKRGRSGKEIVRSADTHQRCIAQYAHDVLAPGSDPSLIHRLPLYSETITAYYNQNINSFFFACV